MPTTEILATKAADADGYTASVFIDGNPTAIASSIHSKCSGDEAGSAKRLISGKTSDKTEFMSYSFDVRCEGEGAVRHQDLAMMNSGNTMGSVLGTATTTSEIDDPPEEDNWIDLEYLYADGTGVAGATYIIRGPYGVEIARGTLSCEGKAHVNLPPNMINVTVEYVDDPNELVVIKPSQPALLVDSCCNDNNFENINAEQLLQQLPIDGKPLPPVPKELQIQEDDFWSGLGVYLKLRWQLKLQELKEAAEWTWGMLQGDFKEDQSIAQIITNAVITMIPVVDQIGDVRDIIANLKLLIWDKRYNEFAPWLALFFTLIGLIPTLGSALKAILKSVWKGAKLKALLKTFNFFMKGDGVKWLKKLQSTELDKYTKQAAEMGHQIFEAVIKKIESLKGKTPPRFKEALEKIDEALETLRIVKSNINNWFKEIAKQLKEKLGIIIKEAEPSGKISPTKVESSVQQGVEGANNRKLQLIGGKPPRNSEFAGKNYSLDVDKNPILKNRLEAMKPKQRRIREQKLKLLAEKYPEGVNFTEKGFANFNPHVLKHNGAKVEVDIQRLNPDPLSGTSGSQLDMNNANELMRALDSNWKQPAGTTWHHIENTTKLQLLPTDLHSVVGHSGGRNTYKF